MRLSLSPPGRPLPTVAVAVALVATALPVLAASPVTPRLEAVHDEWRAAVEPLWTEAEERAWNALSDDGARDRFVVGFWRARPPETLERWNEARIEAARRFPDGRDDRAAALVLAGLPGERVRSACAGPIHAFEVWHWPAPLLEARGHEAEQGLTVLFRIRAEPGGPRATWWDPADGPGLLLDPVVPEADPEDVRFRAGRARCLPDSTGGVLFARALDSALGRDDAERLLAVPPLDPDWFARSTEPRGEGFLEPERLTLDFPGRYQSRTILEGTVRIPAARLAGTADDLFDTVTARGEVRRGRRLLDSFRVTWWIVGSAPDSGEIELAFHRRIHPGPVRLDLRFEDGRAIPLLRHHSDLDVPRLEVEAPAPPGSRKGLGERTRPEVSFLVALPDVEILPLSPTPHVGPLEVAAATVGTPADSVRFLVDGTVAGADEEPPWSATLSLEPAASEDRELVAESLDPDGRVLDRDRTVLVGVRRAPEIDVRGPPRTEGLEVDVGVPAHRDLLELTVRVDGEVAARGSEPRVRLPLDRRPPERPAIVEVEVRLADGETVRRTRLVGSGVLERVDVRLVEVEATVVDGRDRLVTDLGADEFRLFESEVAQPLLEARRVLDRPLDVALVVDASSSMRPRIEALRRAAGGFLDTVVGPRDRASLISFDHEVRRLVPFTDRAELLRWSVESLRAWGTTRLHDALYFTFGSFDGGSERRRSVVLLSDGADVDSDLAFPDVREAAVRAGAVVHAILLDVEDPETRREVTEIARASGGSAFVVGDARRLAPVYRRIEEELRSAYRLVYAAPAEARTGPLPIRIEIVDRPELRVRSRTARMP